MRASLAIICSLAFITPLVAQPSEEEMEKQGAAELVREALRQREPSDSGPIVPSADVAIGIHTAVVRGIYGEGVLRNKPFVAIRTGDYWVVHGTLPKDYLGGTPTTVIRAKDGAVLWVMSQQ